ncbi:MAG: DoxX family membrane protein [Candidatus Spechtbacterales bacterium]
MKNITATIDRYSRFAPLAVRVGVGLVLLWFSTTQLMDPKPWSNIIPAYATGLTGLSAITIVQLNAVFELVLSVALIAGVYTRWAGLLATLHIAQITVMLGYNAIGVRDFGLTMASLAVFLRGDDEFSVTNLFSKKR